MRRYLATGLLGSGHWTQELTLRWDRAHHVEATIGARFRALGQQWLCNTGYGAPLGPKRRRQTAQLEAQNIARFDHEWGLPLLWLAMLAGAALAWRHQPTRHVAGALLVMLVLQVLFWLCFTHLQSRFLIPTLLPACTLLGIGFGRIEQSPRKYVPWAFPLAAVLLTATFTALSFGVFYRQTFSKLAPWQIMDSLAPADSLDAHDDEGRGTSWGTGDHQINTLSKTSYTFLVADNARLIYIRRPFAYHSAFDANPLGDLIRRHRNDPAAVTAALRQAGFTHVWIHWEELERLRGTYGFDPDVTVDELNHLIATGWQTQWRHPSGAISLHRLP